jgi:hypothetical protein
VIHDAIERLREVDATLDPAALARRFAVDLAGDPTRVLEHRADPVVTAVRTDLVALVLRPHLPTVSGRPSAAADRRAARCHLSFDEGYLLGRLALNTHDLALAWSGHAARRSPTPSGPPLVLADDPARSTSFGDLEARARLRALRALVLSAALGHAFTRTERVAPMLDDLTADTRGVPADQARQFAGFGFLTAVCEWAMVLDLRGPTLELSGALL